MALSYKGGDAAKPVPLPRASSLNNLPAPLAAIHQTVAALVPGAFKRWTNIPKPSSGKGTK